MENKYKLIDMPEGGGSSIKDFNIPDNHFYISRGTYGGRKVTLVVFNTRACEDEYCFEGIINFKDENEVIMALLQNGVQISDIFDIIKDHYEETGYRNGRYALQSELKNLLNVY